MNRRCLLWVSMLAPALLAQTGQLAAPPIRLTLKRAVELATSPEGNASLQLAREVVVQSKSRSNQARSALLPDFESTFYRQNNTRNLDVLGLELEVPPQFAPLIHIPRLVGPFDIMDARVSLVQNVVDLSSVRRFQASKALVRAARAEGENTDEMIAGQVARAYLGVLRREAEVEAAGANVELAEAILKTTENQKAAGAGTAIEVTRAKVEAANQRQRLLVAQNERRRAKLILLRTMGLRLDTEYELTDQLRYIPVEPEIVANAHVDAVKSRLDLRAQAERESNSRLAASAAKMERLPTLAAYSDYGTTGSGFDRAVPTRTYGVSLRVPLYDGGRRDARRSDAASQYRQEKIRSNDLRDQIDLEVQTATDTLQSAEEQVQVAEVGLHLAENELDQARRRYEAGVASNLEVTDAQTRLERARNNRITALFSHNLARIDLGQATGSIRKMIQ